jgi:hypothetical protein
MLIAIPIFCLDPPRGTGGKTLARDIRVVREESGDSSSTVSQAEVQGVAGPFCVWSEAAGSNAISGLAIIDDGSSIAGTSIPGGASTGTAGGRSNTLLSFTEAPPPPVGEASTGVASDGESMACPHCLQKRLPAVRAVPHITQDRAVGSGSTAGSGFPGTGTTGMA